MSRWQRNDYDLLSMYKDLKLEDLNLFDFSLAQRLDGYTYEDLIDDRFGPEDSEPAEYEYFTYY